jgi:TolA-binding protein
MSNRVEDLENQVAELQATIDGLTEELVETKERVRELEDQAAEFEQLAESEQGYTPVQEPAEADAPSTAEQQAEARGTDERRDAQVVENQSPADPAESAEAPAAAEAGTDEDEDDDDEIIVA